MLHFYDRIRSCVPTLLPPFNEFVSNTRKNNDRNAIKISTLPSQLLSASFVSLSPPSTLLLRLRSYYYYIDIRLFSQDENFPFDDSCYSHERAKNNNVSRKIANSKNKDEPNLLMSHFSIFIFIFSLLFLAFLSVDNHINGLVVFA